MPDNTPSVGAALTFTENETGFFTSTVNSNPTVNTTVTSLLNNNADRLELIFFNSSANDVWVFTDSTVSTTNGFKLPNGGGFAIFKVRDDFTLVANNWFGIAATGAVSITITEVFRVTFSPGGSK